MYPMMVAGSRNHGKTNLRGRGEHGELGGGIWSHAMVRMAARKVAAAELTAWSEFASEESTVSTS
jgi:hypothetical protein